jgi:hypothetical protein
MADDVTLPATNEVVGTDKIGVVNYQRIKQIHGEDGVNDGDVSTTNPLPVNNLQRPLDFGGASPNALDSVNTPGSESDWLDCKGKSLIVVPVEYSAADVTAPFWIVLRDSNASLGRVYPVKVTPANTGQQNDIRETGYYHSEGIKMLTDGAEKYKVVLADTPTNGGSVSAWGDAV